MQLTEHKRKIKKTFQFILLDLKCFNFHNRNNQELKYDDGKAITANKN